VVRYLALWHASNLACLPHRIRLAEEAEDADALVAIATQEMASPEEQAAHNDRWAARFRHLDYATRLLDALRRADPRLLWDPPFAAYDFTAELAAYARQGAGESLAWVAALRGQEHARRLRAAPEGDAAAEKRFRTAADGAQDAARREADPHKAAALLSIAKLSCEAARRRAGTMAPQPREAAATAALLNARVQLRPGGVRGPRADGLWELPDTAKACVERAAGGAAGLQAHDRARLLAEAMLLLGYWPQPGAAPTEEWQALFAALLQTARDLAGAVLPFVPDP